MRTLLLILILLSLTLLNSSRNITYVSIPRILDVTENPTYETTLDSIYQAILDYRLDHPEIVYSQIVLETGYLTSNLFLQNNNLFGMRVSGSRATTSTIIVDGYKWYPHWRESLLDYALLQMAFYRNKSEESYYTKLGRAYAEDPNYIIKLKNLQEKLKNPQS